MFSPKSSLKKKSPFPKNKHLNSNVYLIIVKCFICATYRAQFLNLQQFLIKNGKSLNHFVYLWLSNLKSYLFSLQFVSMKIKLKRIHLFKIIFSLEEKKATILCDSNYSEFCYLYLFIDALKTLRKNRTFKKLG